MNIKTLLAAIIALSVSVSSFANTTTTDAADKPATEAVKHNKHKHKAHEADKTEEHKTEEAKEEAK